MGGEIQTCVLLKLHKQGLHKLSNLRIDDKATHIKAFCTLPKIPAPRIISVSPKKKKRQNAVSTEMTFKRPSLKLDIRLPLNAAVKIDSHFHSLVHIHTKTLKTDANAIPNQLFLPRLLYTTYTIILREFTFQKMTSLTYMLVT